MNATYRSRIGAYFKSALIAIQPVQLALRAGLYGCPVTKIYTLTATEPLLTSVRAVYMSK